MGCCVSSNRASTSSVAVSQPSKSSISQEKSKPSESKGASFQVEEEKVKEVLSETPKWNPKNTAKSAPEKPHKNNIMAFDKLNKEESKVEKKMKAFPINKAEDTSEVCSLSETMSTTTTITDQREEGEETGKRVVRSPARLQKNRSFSGDLGSRRERTVHGPRNVGSVRLVQCRDQVDQKMGNVGMRRRRDPGENSFRKSGLPATRANAGVARSVMGRSPSAKRTNQSPAARVRTAPPENGRWKMEIPATEGKLPSASESLENPLVSLECFIFI